MHLGRTVLQDFTFSDGTTVPAGSTLYVNSYGLHHDEQLFPSPHTFDGFRFVPRVSIGQYESEVVQERRLEQGGEPKFKEHLEQQPMMAKPTVDYNPFGYGKHAWCVWTHVHGLRLLNS